VNLLQQLIYQNNEILKELKYTNEVLKQIKEVSTKIAQDNIKIIIFFSLYQKRSLLKQIQCSYW